VSTLIEQLAEFAVGIRDAGLDQHRLRQNTHRVLDVVGNCLAASTEEISRTVNSVAQAWGGHPVASVFGNRTRYPTPSAALVNGTLAHSLDFDDTHLPSILHPSSSSVPAALATAERESVDGATLLAGVAVGNEICVRLGMAGYDEELGNSIFFERGQHATAICGAIGAAMAAGLIQGLTATQLASAGGIAASMGAGLLEANRTGGTVKRIHAGWAAHCGTVAAEFAAQGLTGPPTVLEGRFGFFQAWCGDRAKPAEVIDRLGTHWESDNIQVKPYPCNHFTHAGIDAALQLREQGLEPGQIAALELGVPTAVLRTIAEPAELKAAPPTGYAAAFSGPYTVASALLGGGGLGVYLDDFTDAAVQDPRRRTLAGLVRCYADPECDAGFPRQLPAVLRARTTRGAEHQVRITHNRGGPARPLSEEELATKFRLNASRALPPSVSDTLSRAILDLPTTTSLTDILGDRPKPWEVNRSGAR
jgi:2-methylcitrate dehydratase PrpD